MGPTTINGAGRHHVALGWVRHDEALTKTAAACWARDRFTDVTIFCEDRVLHAHRLVLASMSPLLANLLSEAEGNETALMLPEVKAEDMRLLLQFIYQGEVVLPPRRTAALLDLAAQLCVAGVRGGGGPTPPSPPRSDSPELDSSDRNESVHASSEDEHQEGNGKSPSVGDKETETAEKGPLADEDSSAKDDTFEASSDDSNDGPMNLAAKPETNKPNGTFNCPRPKPCNSSPPDIGSNPTSRNNNNNFVTRLSDTRNSALSYYQHPALQGCHPFSLELAVNHHRNLLASRNESFRHNKRYATNHSDKTDGSDDVEVTMDVTSDDTDREIDLSLSKTDFNRSRTSSSYEDKMSPSSDHDSLASHESIDQVKGRGGLLLNSNGSSTAVADMRLSLADKMLLLPSAGGSVDPRRSYLETVLQESLVQQSYTIVLPSHLSSAEQQAAAQQAALHSQAALENSKAWNLAGKNSAAAVAVAELQALQGLLAAREGLSSESNYGRSNALRCDDEDEEDDDDDMVPTNLSKSNNCGSSTSSLSSKRNSKEGYSCQVCRKMFTSSSNLAVHSMIHSGTKPFKCDLCSWSFRQKAHLQKHMRHIHKIIVAK